MEMIQGIMTRKSTRRFTDEPVSEQDIRTILRAGMSGPSCVNKRMWSFVVVTDKDMLNKMADINGRAAEPLRRATLGILVCGDLSRAFEAAPEYWVIDAAIATENMTLAAHGLGLGSVWIGTWPQESKVSGQKELFGLPDHMVPHSIMAFGHPEDGDFPERDLYEEERVHWGKW